MVRVSLVEPVVDGAADELFALIAVETAAAQSDAAVQKRRAPVRSRGPSKQVLVRAPRLVAAESIVETKFHGVDGKGLPEREGSSSG